ncbi:hypothetical protein [Streptomyces sp. NPDC015131]|uniref:hypothetical protein n=1 Tax=Streptomyces sp. NPDC015131 TaxID=3364941 RepID=UPI0037022E1C
MAALSTHQLVSTGTPPTFVAANAGGDTAEVGNGRDTFIVVKNGHTSAQTVTITVPGSTVYGELNPDPAISVPNGGERWIPLRKEYDASDGTGRCGLTYPGGVTALTVAVVRTG